MRTSPRKRSDAIAWRVSALGPAPSTEPPAAGLRPARSCGRGDRQLTAHVRACQDSAVDVLSSRILLRPADLDRSRRFYRDVLGLAVYREFGSPADPGGVFFLGPGFLEVSGRPIGPPRNSA